MGLATWYKERGFRLALLHSYGIYRISGIIPEEFSQAAAQHEWSAPLKPLMILPDMIRNVYEFAPVSLPLETIVWGAKAAMRGAYTTLFHLTNGAEWGEYFSSLTHLHALHNLQHGELFDTYVQRNGFDILGRLAPYSAEIINVAVGAAAIGASNYLLKSRYRQQLLTKNDTLEKRTDEYARTI